MSTTLEAVKSLVAVGEVKVSEHGYDEMSEDSVRVRDVFAGLPDAVVVEDYPNFGKGPAVLALQFDSEGRPLHGRMGNSKRSDDARRLSNSWV